MYKSAPVIITGLLMAVSTYLHAAPTLEDRLVRIENLLNNQVLIEQMQQMEQIRQELSEIRELVENQDHQLGLIKQRQRNLYQDMDRRLHDLEAGSSATASAPVAAPTESQPVSPVTPPGAAGSSSVVSAATPGDKDGKLAYGQAFNVLKEGRYQQAIIDFKNFMNTYPESRYSANAQYWLAEAHYSSRDFKTALQGFQNVLSKYPESNKNKVLGAELKIGYTYYEMQDWPAARAALERVIANHPNTTVAKKAQERLERMKREGH
ncbi:MAG: tol-pal system protein YbgF [Gammaproteobacteria bacterium]|nr:tol-pal system protein YbgF [Gammaproteobacteria bacterium]